MPPPDVPPPTEERLFTNWSSIDSQRERGTQCNQLARSAEPNITVIQTEQPTIGPEESKVLGNTLSDVTTIPSTHQQLSQVGTRYVDRETNMSEVEIRPQREETRIDIKHIHSKGVKVPTSHSELSSDDIDIGGDASARPRIPDIMPQLDGPTSIHARRRHVQEFIQRTATMPRGGYPDESDIDSHDNRRSHDEQRHSGRRRHYHDRGGRPPDRRNDQERGYSRRGRPPDREPPDDGGPPNDGGPPDDNGPPDDGGPLMMEDPQEMEDLQDNLEDKDHLAHQCILS